MPSLAPCQPVGAGTRDPFSLPGSKRTSNRISRASSLGTFLKRNAVNEVVRDTLKPLWKLALAGYTEEAAGATESDIDVFVDQLLVNIGHAVEANVKHRLEFQTLDALNGKDADPPGITQVVTIARAFHLEARWFEP